MRTFVSNSAEYAQHIQRLKESYCFVPGLRVVHQNKNQDAIAVCVMSGINTISRISIIVLMDQQFNDNKIL